MDTLNSLPLLVLLFFSICICIFGRSEELEHRLELEMEKQQTLRSLSNGKKLLNPVRKLDASTTPITNPANFPPYTPSPTIVTVPASNPTTFNPLPPPTTTVPTSTSPVPISNPAAPVTNPATTYPTPTTGNIPATNPTNQPTNGPVTPGQTWCIAKTGTPEVSLQDALDYACGIGGADCSTIQQGGSCYNPNSIENHASYAFNSYFQRNPVSSSCDFGGVAVLVNTNPSTGTCVYPSSATAATTPTTPSSTVPQPTTTSSSGATGPPYEVPAFGGYGSPPALSNPTNSSSAFPASYGPDSPPTGNSVPANSALLQPCIGLLSLAASFSVGKLTLNT